MQPFDWYIVITPFFIVLLLSALLTLKMSLKAQPNISDTLMKKLRSQKQQKTQKQQQSAIQQYKTLKVLNYLIRNHCLLQVYLTRKSKNKLTFLLSIALISILCIFNPSIFINSTVGIPITLTFILVQSCFQPIDQSTNLMSQQQQQLSIPTTNMVTNDQNPQLKGIKYLYMIYSILTSISCLFLSWFTFNNYSNLFLHNFIKNIAINSVLDLIVIRPICFILCSFVLACNSNLMQFIDNQQLKDNYQGTTMYKSISQIKKQLRNNCKIKINKNKLVNSPLKISKQSAKSIENFQNITLQQQKIIVKQHISQQNILNPNPTFQCTNQIQNQHTNTLQYGLQIIKHGRDTPISILHEDDQQNKEYKTRKKQTQLVIVSLNKQQKQNIQNQKQQITINQNNGFYHQNFILQDSNQNMRQIRQLGAQLHNRRILRLTGASQNYSQSSETYGHKQKYSMTSANQKNDGLRVSKLDDGKQIQQLQLTSPLKRRSHKKQQLGRTSYHLRKKNRVRNNIKTRHQIKIIHGKPYLQYLPNMLVKGKDKHLNHKKSQPINVINQETWAFQPSSKLSNKKQHIFDFVNDENAYPKPLFVQDL